MASKRWMWPRQKGHRGAARPRAHSWYAHCRHSPWRQLLILTSSAASMQMEQACTGVQQSEVSGQPWHVIMMVR